MSRNQRIFYACQAVAITPRGAANVDPEHVVHGVQSIGMSSTFTLDQVFEQGQIEIYENIEEVSDIEVTLEKVLDGYKLIYDLATQGACKTDIVAASKARSDVYVAVFDDGLSHATGVPRNVVMNSGMYVSSVSYSYSIDGSATESVTLVGNDRFWNGETAGVLGTSAAAAWSVNPTSNIDGTDTPLSGVVRRVNVDLANSTLPGIVKSQSGDDTTGRGGGHHVQSISVSTDFGQENIQELGRFGPYHRYATFPIEVTCEFEVISTSGDLVSVSGNAPNLSDEDILIKDTAGTILDLGSGGAGKNKLSSVSYSGADTGGGNATVSYSFSNFNVLTVQGGAAHA
tara:strand:+ start:779 stop:1807 length:1029 start_codon:yes stop_codon:yes gene_type:complete